MPVLDVVQALTQALYVLVFALALWTAIRHPRPITIETALLFGAAASSVALGWMFALEGAPPPRLVTDIAAALALVIPYLLLRLVDEFAGVPFTVQRLAEAGLVVSVALRFIYPAPAPLWATLVLVAYFALVTLYATGAYAHGAHSSVGSTARRMGAVAVGSGLLCGAVVIARLQMVFPALNVPLGVLGGPFGLASGLAFYLGFTPPLWVLRIWREPELRDFMERMDELAPLAATPTPLSAGAEAPRVKEPVELV